MRIAQLSDTHIFAPGNGNLRGMDTAHSLARVVTVAQTLPLDLVLVTGDLSQDETPESYQRLKEILHPLQVPIHYLVGNHDNSTAMLQAWGTTLATQPRALVQDGWQLLLLNSTVAGEVWGKLSPSTLDWLAKCLMQCCLPTLIALHHPPIVPDPQWQKSVLTNPEALYQLVDRYPHVRCVIAGHVHQPLHYQHGHVAYLTAPSTCLQYDQPKDSPLDWHYPGLRFLDLQPDGNWLTRIVRAVS
jgi:Icc protein